MLANGTKWRGEGKTKRRKEKTNIGTISGKDDGHLESGGGRRSKGKAKGEGTQESDGQIYADEESDGIMNLGNNHINI